MLNPLKLPIIFISIGIVAIVVGIILSRREIFNQTKVEVISSQTIKNQEKSVENIVVELAGAVERPGVYKLPSSI